MLIKFGQNKQKYPYDSTNGSYSNSTYSMSLPSYSKLNFPDKAKPQKIIHDNLAISNISKEPLKNNSFNDISFKGSFFNVNVVASHSIKESNGLVQKAIKNYGKTFGEEAGKHLSDVITKLSEDAPQYYKNIQSEKGVLKLLEKSTSRELKENLTYPFIQMPMDLANSALGFVDKISKNKKIGTKIRQSMPVLEKHYQKTIFEKEMAGVSGYLKAFKENGEKFKLFNEGHKMLSSNLPNYSTATERFLARLDSGTVSALFLATDAYNLSSLLHDNKSEAKKDSKRRFQQEAGRVGFSAYMTLVALGVLKKLTNKSLPIAVAVTGVTTLITEIIGRVLVGNKILPMTQKQSEKEFQQDKTRIEDTKAQPQKDDKDKHAVSFLANLKKENADKNSETHKNLTKLLTFVGVYAAGAVLLKQKGVKAALEPISQRLKNVYNKAFFKDSTISADKLKAYVKRLDDMGFDAIGEKHNAIIENYKLTDKGYSLGKSPKKKLKALFDTGLCFPFKFFNGIMKIPVSLVNYTSKFFNKNKSVKIIKDLQEAKILKEFKDVTGVYVDENKIAKTRLTNSQLKTAREMLKPEKFEEIYLAHFKKKLNQKGMLEDFLESGEINSKSAKEYFDRSNDLERVKNCINFVEKHKDSGDLKNILNTKILSSLDKTSNPNYATTDLQSWTKFLCSGITGVFLVFDNYNMVMKKTAGKDKDLAAQKGQERAVQEVSRNFFSSYFVKLISDVFKDLYHSSLFGVATIIAGQVFGYETFTRKAVGLPVTKSSKTEIQEAEKKNESKQGFWGKYYRFMSYVTGKKSLSSRIENKTQNAGGESLYSQSFSNIKKDKENAALFNQFS